MKWWQAGIPIVGAVVLLGAFARGVPEIAHWVGLVLAIDVAWILMTARSAQE